MRSTPSRRSDASHSRRIESGFSTCRGGVMGSCSSQTRPHFVKINGRFEGGSSRSSRPTTSSECPSPYTAAVSIDRKSTRLNSSHTVISYAVFCLKKKKKKAYPSYTVTNTKEASGPNNIANKEYP